MTTYETNQQVFDHVFKRMAAQGFKQSRNESNTGCRYRGFNNHVCAIGTMIDDDQYFPDIETYSINMLISEKLISVSKEVVDSKILQYLQGDHDMGAIPESMERNLRSTAQLLGLVVPHVGA